MVTKVKCYRSKVADENETYIAYKNSSWVLILRHSTWLVSHQIIFKKSRSFWRHIYIIRINSYYIEPIITNLQWKSKMCSMWVQVEATCENPAKWAIFFEFNWNSRSKMKLIRKSRNVWVLMNFLWIISNSPYMHTDRDLNSRRFKEFLRIQHLWNWVLIMIRFVSAFTLLHVHWINQTIVAILVGFHILTFTIMLSFQSSSKSALWWK